MTSPAVISCLFGTLPFDIYPAPQEDRCFFFTNRQNIADRAAQRGWEPVMMALPEKTDPLALSLQSKAVKFLTFLNDPYYRAVTDRIEGPILYFDHKFRVEQAHIDAIVARADGAAILLRSTPKLKTSVWDEIAAAMHQERYTRHMDETKRYVETVLQAGISADTRICNTGLIYYGDPKAALPLTQTVFSTCLMQNQPECQIFWAIHAQSYASQIKVIDWQDPAVADILWQDPHPNNSKAPKSRRSLWVRVKSRLRRLAAG